MSLRRSEVAQTTTLWQTHILTPSGGLVGGDKFYKPPTATELMECLVRFNFQRRDEYFATSVVVLKIVTTRSESDEFVAPIDDIKAEITKRQGVPVRKAKVGPPAEVSR